MTWALDSLDRDVLYRLQDDARNTSSSDITEYDARVDFETTGSQLHTRIICTAPIPDRNEFAGKALDVEGVVDVPSKPET
jgi:DNA-binding Lrp family transcriptional regulator